MFEPDEDHPTFMKCGYHTKDNYLYEKKLTSNLYVRVGGRRCYAIFGEPLCKTYVPFTLTEISISELNELERFARYAEAIDEYMKDKE